jgi:hypothetical protein
LSRIVIPDIYCRNIWFHLPLEHHVLSSSISSHYRFSTSSASKEPSTSIVWSLQPRRRELFKVDSPVQDFSPDSDYALRKAVTGPVVKLLTAVKNQVLPSELILSSQVSVETALTACRPRLTQNPKPKVV